MFSYFHHFEYDLGQNHRLLLPADHSMKIVLPNISTYFSGIHLIGPEKLVEQLCTGLTVNEITLSCYTHAPTVLIGTFASFIPPLRVSLIKHHNLRLKTELWKGKGLKGSGQVLAYMT